MTYYSNMSSTINRAPSVRKSCFFFSTQPRGTPLLSFFFFLMIRRPPRSTRYETLFPYRRSSDLFVERDPTHDGGSRRVGDGQLIRGLRSEEHTSELQSLRTISYAVFCLKKKK